MVVGRLGLSYLDAILFVEFPSSCSLSQGNLEVGGGPAAGVSFPGSHRAHTGWEARLAHRCLAPMGWVRKEHQAHLKVGKLSMSRVSSEL